MNNAIEKMNQSQKILFAAFKCISSRGYANVSLRDIADEAGVVLSQLNYYYRNKEGLYKEVIKMMMQKYLLEIENCLQRGATAKEKTLSLIKYFQEMLNKNPELFRLLYDFTGMAIWSPPFGELLRNLFKDLSNLIEKYIISDAAIKENLKTYATKPIARMLFGAMFGTAIQVILDPEEKSLPESLFSIQVLFE
ncbi:MAG: TetR/AcrR family transcriptional regulator [Peptococcaceae bacterium]|jgi:AcrR family transcriptional regulator|nr:TetR/AcrR family transcriptional regulator [Peptococcaceae bacterium]MDH7524975.1 TetR/AcrR family transcriptional regulator [Peptococcaceae bacterium]